MRGGERAIGRREGLRQDKGRLLERPSLCLHIVFSRDSPVLDGDNRLAIP